jgi:hypothetical protein
MDLDIDEIFNDVISIRNPQENAYPLGFELDSIKELFEFLLQFTTMLCKHFYGDANGQVDLSTLAPNDFIMIDAYVRSIGFACMFDQRPANGNNLNWANDTRYDRIHITSETKLQDLHLALRCGNTLFVISFQPLNNSC